MLKLIPSIPSYTSYTNYNQFCFLNTSYTFGNIIDWSYTTTGKLWSYNLNYFEFLEQVSLKKEDGIRLIKNFVQYTKYPSVSFEPFPISLRLVFWIKFLVKQNTDDNVIKRSVAWQAKILYDNIEYHLLGNHLLENGFALLYAAYFLQSKKLYIRAKDILITELEEQILTDGAHFELSPMYHQLMIYRLLDCINLVQNNSSFGNDSLQELLQKKAGIMLGWIKQMTFVNGCIPLFNDSALGIAPDTLSLIDYAAKLQVMIIEIPLSASGYRKMVYNKMELIADVGKPGPAYLLAHAHADMLSFELTVNGNPFIVDTGTSTYEKNELRQSERITSAHNTATIGTSEQSQVWGGFRVAGKATVVIEKDEPQFVQAVCKHYNNGVTHRRSFKMENASLIIQDELEGSQATGDHKAFFHFYPGIKVQSEEDVIRANNQVQVRFKADNYQLVLKKYFYASGFGLRTEATMLEVIFTGNLQTQITPL